MEINFYESVIEESKGVEALCTEALVLRSSKYVRQLSEAAEWQEELDLEIQTTSQQKVWTPVAYNKEYRIIDTLWVSIVKRIVQGEITTFKV